MIRPNLFIVGAPKAGTTSLYKYLTRHPDIFMSTPKEVNYFSSGEIIRQQLYYKSYSVNTLKDYEQLFINGKNKKIVGEASVSYLFYPEVPEKIYKFNPKAKIIILLRDPIERGFSHYLMDLRLGLVNIPFDDIILKTSYEKKINLYYQQYVKLGFYYEQVKRYFDTFGKNQVKILLTEEINCDITNVLSSIYTFLEISDEQIPNVKKKYNVYRSTNNKILKILYSFKILRLFMSLILTNNKKDSIKNLLFTDKNKPTINQKTREHLLHIYKFDNLKLEELISRNLSHWYHGAN